MCGYKKSPRKVCNRPISVILCLPLLRLITLFEYYFVISPQQTSCRFLSRAYLAPTWRRTPIIQSSDTFGVTSSEIGVTAENAGSHLWLWFGRTFYDLLRLPLGMNHSTLRAFSFSIAPVIVLKSSMYSLVVISMFSPLKDTMAQSWCETCRSMQNAISDCAKKARISAGHKIGGILGNLWINLD